MSRVKDPSAPRCAKTKAEGIGVPLVAFMGSRAENPNRQAESRFEEMEEGTQLSVFLSVRRAGSQVSREAWCRGRAEATPRSRTCSWIPWCLLLCGVVEVQPHEAAPECWKWHVEKSVSTPPKFLPK